MFFQIKPKPRKNPLKKLQKTRESPAGSRTASAMSHETKTKPHNPRGKRQKKSAAAYPQRIKSERGDSNARPLRPERSALPTALLSVLRMQSYEKIDNIIASANFFTQKFARYKKTSYFCTRNSAMTEKTKRCHSSVGRAKD